MRVVLCIIATLVACSCSPQKGDPAGTKTLAEAFIAANQAESIEPMMALYALEGSDAFTLQLLKAALQSELGLPIAEIFFEPLSGAPEETIAYQHGGKNYGPTLEPSYRMRVVYATEDKFASLYTIGQESDGTWRIISAKPLDEATD